MWFTAGNQEAPRGRGDFGRIFVSSPAIVRYTLVFSDAEIGDIESSVTGQQQITTILIVDFKLLHCRFRVIRQRRIVTIVCVEMPPDSGIFT